MDTTQTTESPAPTIGNNQDISDRALVGEVAGDELSTALRTLSKMAYQKTDLPHLNCVRMDGGVWVATDGHALLVLEVEFDVDACIPLKSVKDMIPLAKGDGLPWQVDPDERRFVSESRDISLSWMHSNEEFPEWRKVLPKDGRTPGNPSFSAAIMKRSMDALLVLGCNGVTMHTGEGEMDPMLMVGHGLVGDFILSARVVLMGIRV